jgi:hypothetical protein
VDCSIHEAEKRWCSQNVGDQPPTQAAWNPRRANVSVKVCIYFNDWRIKITVK